MEKILSSKLKRLKIYLFDWAEGLIWKITEGHTIKSRKNKFGVSYNLIVICDKIKNYNSRILSK